MGFQDLQNFIRLMLAKQSWRIMTDEISLLRVYKAKYFPDHTFMKAKMGRASSYAWKVIWEARTRVREGCRWQVRDRQSIRIWSDYWITVIMRRWRHLLMSYRFLEF